MENFIKEMPKIELHAHLNGSLTTEVLLELGALKYGSTNKEFENLVNNFNVIGESLTECFKKFKIAHDVTSTKECLQRATLCVIRDFALDRVVYLELRTTPKQTDSMSKLEYLQCVLDAIRSARKEYPQIIVKLLPSIDRTQGIDSARSTFATVLQLKENYSDIIKGIDFSGNPSVGQFHTYRDLFREIQNSHLELALHCGEVKNDTEISEMIEFGKFRCGHGTFINGENLTRLLAKHIPVECCLSSNVKCGTVPSYNDHHFKYFLDNDHPVVICTDDFGVFGTTLTDEFLIAQKTFNLSKDILLVLTKNAIESSFADDSEKNQLLKEVAEYFI